MMLNAPLDPPGLIPVDPAAKILLLVTIIFLQEGKVTPPVGPTFLHILFIN